MSSLRLITPLPSPLEAANWPDAAQQIRRRLQPYSLESIIDVAISCLDHFRGQGLEELRSAPWITLLIVKLALEDDNIQFTHRPSMPGDLLDQLRNMVWAMPPHDESEDKPGVYLMVRSLLHTQILLQRNQSWGFLRWPALIERLPNQHPTRLQFMATLGMEPDVWSALAFATVSVCLEGKTFIERGWFNPLRDAYGDAVDVFLGQLSRDVQSLRAELRAELHGRIYEIKNGKRVLRPNGSARPRREKNEFPWLARYPLLVHASGHLAIWHRLVFAQGLEQAVHARLSGLGQTYTDDFSKVFENYVVEIAKWTGLPVVDEDAYKKAGNRSLKAVDAIIPLGNVNLLIESKMSLFPDEVVVSDKEPQVFMKLRRIREAVLQGWRVGELLRDGTVDLPQCSAAAQDYLIVVASRQLNVGFGDNLRNMFGDDVFGRLNPEERNAAPSDAQLARLPPRHMFFLDIEEFELLAAGVKAGNIDLRAFLAEVTESIGTPEGARLFFGQLLEGLAKEWELPPLMQEARDRVLEDLSKRLADVGITE